MAETETESEIERYARFCKLGREAGEAAGSWVTDGNTSADTARRILQGIEDGDPEIMDYQPSPLSGEWAGESMVELLGEGYSDEDADAYEEGYSEGFWDTVTEDCKRIVQPDRTSAGWACVDCLMFLVNGETPPEMTEDETEAYVNLWDEWDAYEITAGRMLGADDCNCWDWDTDHHREICERQAFSSRRCDICRRPNNAGERHAVTFTHRAVL